jgi:ribose transport system permease protein
VNATPNAVAPPGRHGEDARAAPKVLRAVFSEHATLVLAVAYFLAVWPLVPDLATPANLTNLFMNMLPLLAVALGQTVVLITGGIDLSVTSIVAAASVAAAWAMTAVDPATGQRVPQPATVPLAVALALGIGLAVGAFNGAAVAGLSLPPFIVTLGTMMMLGGATLWAAKSRNIANLPDRFTEVGFGSFAGLPYGFWVVAALAVAIHLTLTHTLPGRWLYATGHNARAALTSGVPVRRVTAAAYGISGVCAAVGSLLYTARLQVGTPTMGREILLDVIGAVVIGGTSLFGGRAKVLWTVSGVLLFSLIANSLDLLGLQPYTIMIVKGAVILVAAGLDVLRNRVLAGA